jgi:hypothetical protein
VFTDGATDDIEELQKTINLTSMKKQKLVLIVPESPDHVVNLAAIRPLLDNGGQLIQLPADNVERGFDMFATPRAFNFNFTVGGNSVSVPIVSLARKLYVKLTNPTQSGIKRNWECEYQDGSGQFHTKSGTIDFARERSNDEVAKEYWTARLARLSLQDLNDALQDAEATIQHDTPID